MVEEWAEGFEDGWSGHLQWNSICEVWQGCCRQELTSDVTVDGQTS